MHVSLQPKSSIDLPAELNAMIENRTNHRAIHHRRSIVRSMNVLLRCLMNRLRIVDSQLFNFFHK